MTDQHAPRPAGFDQLVADTTTHFRQLGFEVDPQVVEAELAALLDRYGQDLGTGPRPYPYPDGNETAAP